MPVLPKVNCFKTCFYTNLETNNGIVMVVVCVLMTVSMYRFMLQGSATYGILQT